MVAGIGSPRMSLPAGVEATPRDPAERRSKALALRPAADVDQLEIVRSPSRPERYVPRNALELHAASFDWDRDGVVTFKDTYRSVLEADEHHRVHVALIAAVLTMITRGTPRYWPTKVDLRTAFVTQPGASDGFKNDGKSIDEKVEEILARSGSKDGRFTTANLNELTRKNAPGFRFGEALIWRVAWKLFMSNGEVGPDGERYLSRAMLRRLYSGALMYYLIKKNGRTQRPK